MSRIGKKSRCLWILLVLVSVLVFGGCSQKEENRGEPPKEVLHPQENNVGDGAGGSQESESESSKQGSTGTESDILTGVVAVKIGLNDDTEYLVDMYNNRQVQTILGYLSDSEMRFPTYTYEEEEGYVAQNIRGNYSRDDEVTISDIHAGELYLFSDGQLRLYFKDVTGAEIKATPVGHFTDCDDITKRVEDAYEENRDDSWGVEVYFLIKKRAEESAREDQIKVSVGDSVFTATLEKNSSADALKELLQEGPLTIEMSDYGHMEKVGSIGTSLPTNDENITTEAGDIILYQGNSLTIYYDTNTWNLTRIGRIEDVTKEKLLEVMGSGDVTVTLTLVS